MDDDTRNVLFSRLSSTYMHTVVVAEHDQTPRVPTETFHGETKTNAN